MTTMKRNLTRGLLPALLLSAALAVPAASVAAPGPQGRAHAAAKQNQQKKAEQNARKAQARAVKAQRNAVKAQQKAVKAQRKVAVRTVAPQRVVVQPRRTVVVPQRTVVVPQRRVVAQRVVVPQRRVVVTQPTYVARNRRAWQGWNNNGRYNRYGTGNFQLEGTYIGQQYGCALVQDRSGQVIPLLGNPGNLRKGDYLVMSGAIQNSSVCGTAFRVFSVDNINGGDYYNGRYRDTYRQDPYNDRNDRDNRNLISITGRLDDSGRCPVVRGDRGEYYDLVGDLRNFRDGDHARVVGFLGVRSRCGGQAIDVQEID